MMRQYRVLTVGLICMLAGGSSAPYRAGDYGHTPTCAPQYGVTTVRTVLEVRGQAPFAFHNLESGKPEDALSNCMALAARAAGGK